MVKMQTSSPQKQNKVRKKFTRRNLLKMSAWGVAALSMARATQGVAQAAKVATAKLKKFVMVIDLHRCVGCGACIISCKNENNVQTGFTWASKISKTVGKFPNVRYEYMPTLCNHCEKAPCVEVCPTGAMHKGDYDITMHNPQVCIGCKTCIAACPYGVISFNKKKPYKFWRNDQPLIEGATSSGKEIVKKVKATAIPYYNPDREATLARAGTRYRGIVEKCTFCDHRVKYGKLPYCVQRCPAKARVFGDINNPNSKVNQILGKYRPTRLKEHLATEPKVYYVRSLNPGTYQSSRGSV